MKKAFVTIMIAAAIALSGTISAQDAEKKATCDKQKTECCKKAEKKECCKKAEKKECCKKAEKKECCKKADKKECEKK